MPVFDVIGAAIGARRVGLGGYGAYVNEIDAQKACVCFSIARWSLHKNVLFEYLMSQNFHFF